MEYQEILKNANNGIRITSEVWKNETNFSHIVFLDDSRGYLEMLGYLKCGDRCKVYKDSPLNKYKDWEFVKYDAQVHFAENGGF